MKKMKRLTALMAFLSILWSPLSRADDVPSLLGHIETAKGYMQAHQWEYASYAWREALKEAPQNLEARLGLAETLAHSGLVEDSIELLEAGRSLSQSPLLLLALAKQYQQGNQTIKAGEIYYQLLQKEPFQPTAFAQLQDLLPALPSPYQEWSEKLLDKNGQQAQQQGKKAFQEHRYKEAALFYEIVASHQPSPKNLNHWGLALLLAGKTQQAQRILSDLERKASTWPVQVNMAMAYLGEGKPYTAQKALEKALAINLQPSEKAKIYNNLGYVYEVNHKLTKARFAYERAVTLDPSLLKAQKNLGYVYRRAQEYPKAIALYQSLLSQGNRLSSTDQATLWNELGFTYELNHKPRQALDAYHQAIALNARYKDAYFNLGTLYKKLNKMAKATQAYRQMANLEFVEMEADPHGKKSQAAKLFEYVDLFTL